MSLDPQHGLHFLQLILLKNILKFDRVVIQEKHLYFDTYSRFANMHQGVSLQKKKIICDSPICLSHFQFQTRPENIHYEKHASCIQSIPHNTTLNAWWHHLSSSIMRGSTLFWLTVWSQSKRTIFFDTILHHIQIFGQSLHS